MVHNLTKLVFITLIGIALSAPCDELDALSGCSTACNGGSEEVPDRGFCEAKNKKCCRTNCAGPGTFCIGNQKSCENTGEGFDEVDGTCPNDEEFRCCAPSDASSAALMPGQYPPAQPEYQPTAQPPAPEYQTTVQPPPAPETTQAPAPNPTAPPPPPEEKPKPPSPDPQPTDAPEPATAPPQPDPNAPQQPPPPPPVKDSSKGKNNKKGKKKTQKKSKKAKKEKVGKKGKKKSRV